MFKQMIGFAAVAGLVFALAPAQAALVAYWNFDEGEGPTADDFSANNNDGTLVATFGPKPAWTTGHTGNPGDNALSFVRMGANCVEIPDDDSLHITDTFTVAAWGRETGNSRIMGTSLLPMMVHEPGSSRPVTGLATRHISIPLRTVLSSTVWASYLRRMGIGTISRSRTTALL